eukprot:2290724-Prymnesium_polylepis.1
MLSCSVLQLPLRREHFGAIRKEGRIRPESEARWSPPVRVVRAHPATEDARGNSSHTWPEKPGLHVT